MRKKVKAAGSAGCMRQSWTKQLTQVDRHSWSLLDKPSIHPIQLGAFNNSSNLYSPAQTGSIKLDLTRLRAARKEVVDGRLDARFALLSFEEYCEFSLLHLHSELVVASSLVQHCNIIGKSTAAGLPLSPSCCRQSFQ